MSKARRQSGFTMVEVAIVAAFTLAGLAVVGSLLGTTEDLTDDTRTQMRSATEHRRNLETLANLLRAVDITTLQGFDEQGVATAPSFRRVSGVDVAERSYLPAERIEWRTAKSAVWGVPRPGALWLVGGSDARLLAKNVPAGGFQLRQEGNTLAIRLTTYYSIGTSRTVHTTGETAVSLRN